MPAPFINDLCGYRSGRPNTSDRNDPLSVELGNELFDRLGVAPGKPEPSDVGNALTAAVVADLKKHRPDLEIRHDRAVYDYSQYRHLAALAKLRKAQSDPLQKQVVELATAIDSEYERGRLAKAAHTLLARRVNKLADSSDAAAASLRELVDQLGAESLLKLDIVVARAPGGDHPEPLSVGLSAKWSLRTDRAQDCVSQGAKLVSLRRGRMPHFGLVTIEPRPAMLALVADGSGSVDFVYHLALPQLIEAVQALEEKRSRANWSPAGTLRRLVAQGRVRDYDELVAEVRQLASA